MTFRKREKKLLPGLTLAGCFAYATFIASPCTAQQLPQNPGKKIFAPSESPEQKSDTAKTSPALPFIETGKKLIGEERFTEAKEAFKTALRLEPMNPRFWGLYDDAVISDYVEKKRREKTNPVVERDIQPTFAINRVDSYIELGTIYVVGSLQNLSNEARQKIQLTARMLDENKKELRNETGYLRNIDKSLLPNESSLFEIPFKNPPAGAKSFRVEVTAWE